MTGEDLDREDFAQAVANRLRERSDVTAGRALELAEALISDWLDHEGIEFGSAGYDWSRAGAIDLADEELSCWATA